MNKKVILFDIDYTLFNTDKFRDLTYPALKKLLDQEDNPTYHQVVKEIEHDLIKKGGYDPIQFGRLLSEALQMKSKRADIEALFEKETLYEECLYEDVLPTLQKLSSMNDIVMGIISKGDVRFQKKKIQSITSYFSTNAVFISNEKVDQLERVKKEFGEDPLYLVDDSEPFLQTAQRELPNSYTFLIERENRYETRVAIADFIPNTKITTVDEIFSNI